jgi:hypothetical protein
MSKVDRRNYCGKVTFEGETRKVYAKKGEPCAHARKRVLDDMMGELSSKREPEKPAALDEQGRTFTDRTDFDEDT